MSSHLHGVWLGEPPISLTPVLPGIQPAGRKPALSSPETRGSLRKPPCGQLRVPTRHSQCPALLSYREGSPLADKPGPCPPPACTALLNTSSKQGRPAFYELRHHGRDSDKPIGNTHLVQKVIHILEDMLLKSFPVSSNGYYKMLCPQIRTGHREKGAKLE